VTHLSLDELGDVDAAQHDAHVMGCEQCRQVVEEQRAVRTLLSGLPAPQSAPPDVVAAIQAAVRAEAAARAAQADPAGDGGEGSGATIIPLGEADARRAGRRPARYLHRGRGPQLLAAAAAAVVVVGGGALVSQQLTSAGSESADAAAGGATSETAARSGGAEDAAGALVLTTGTDYTKARLVRQVDALLGRRPTSTTSGDAAAATGPLSRPGALDGCLQALGATTTPLAVDVGTYERRPAAVVVLPAAGGGREVWVVEPTCRVGADGTLYYTRLP